MTSIYNMITKITTVSMCDDLILQIGRHKERLLDGLKFKGTPPKVGDIFYHQTCHHWHWITAVIDYDANTKEIRYIEVEAGYDLRTTKAWDRARSEYDVLHLFGEKISADQVPDCVVGAYNAYIEAVDSGYIERRR